jgi:hypothetical protein
LVLLTLEEEVVVPSPHGQASDLLPVVVSSSPVIRPTTVMLSENVTMALESCVATQSRVNRDWHGRVNVAYPHDLGSAPQEVQDPVAEEGVQSQGPKVGDEHGGDIGC